MATVASEARGGAWTAEETILFTPQAGAGLRRVPADSGQDTPLTASLSSGTAEYWPHALLGRRQFLYLARKAPGTGAVFLAALDARTPKRLFNAQSKRGVTFEPAAVGPVWSPDGAKILYTRPMPLNLHIRETGGTGREERLTRSPNTQIPFDWSRDGRFILCNESSPVTRWDLWALPLDGDRKPIPAVQGPSDEVQGLFSPDGKWIAYTSNESGREEIYVRAFPPSGGACGGFPRTVVLSRGGAATARSYSTWRRMKP